MVVICSFFHHKAYWRLCFRVPCALKETQLRIGQNGGSTTYFREVFSPHLRRNFYGTRQTEKWCMVFIGKGHLFITLWPFMIWPYLTYRQAKVYMRLTGFVTTRPLQFFYLQKIENELRNSSQGHVFKKKKRLVHWPWLLQLPPCPGDQRKWLGYRSVWQGNPPQNARNIQVWEFRWNLVICPDDLWYFVLDWKNFLKITMYSFNLVLEV